MRKTYLLLSLLCTVTMVYAHERSIEEKLAAASTVVRSTQPAMAKANAAGQKLRIQHSSEMLTVIGNDNGFALIANDDMFNAVVGYSDNAFVLDENNSLSWFMYAAGESMKARIADGKPSYAPTAPDTERFKASIAPIVSTTWNQSKPYNDLCPKDTKGNGYPSGCVATALSQIMKHHRYPVHGYGRKSYSFSPSEGVGELLSAEFESTYYQWDSMLDNYISGQYSAEEGNAVATLMFHAGVAVEMNYTPSGSGAYSSEARNGLMKHFGYNKNISLLYRDYYSQKEWMNFIFNELSNERPVYYAGSDKQRGGHAFVIDGYDENGFVHVNWGWGADGGNGFYDIALLNPTGYSFSIGQDMLIGIALPDKDIRYEPQIVSDHTMSAAKITDALINVAVGQTVWNLSGDAWSGELGIILKGNGQEYVLAQKPVKTTPYLYNVLSNMEGALGGLLSLPSGLSDGEYRLFTASKGSPDKGWSLVRRKDGQTNSYLMDINNGKVTLNAANDDSWPSTGIKKISGSNAAGTYYDVYGRPAASSTRGIILHKQGNGIRKIVVR
ncbi:streptopain [Palleniella muris]|uniref:Streptopain n=1 Tax=Palleniella muris TaxID=3038145 RepID=A0AC61QS05_9BACT|nr:C10 family peptidase [Palleniella muris]TGX83115.1 streptopain [Palleniella muris]